jgi:glycine cleavage system H protein
MRGSLAPEGKEACIWMTAGLLTYRLCDRHFDCDRCPLDAALRGGISESRRHDALLTPNRDANAYPEDRFYTRGHAWAQTIGARSDRRLRLGLDAFAAAIIGRCSRVHWLASESCFGRGDVLCQIDLGLGILPLGAPLKGKLCNGNRTLDEEPSRLVTAPYEQGWLVEVVAEEPIESNDLLTAAAARENTRLDLQRFRHRIAIQLFDDAQGAGRTLPDGGEVLTDLRQMVGGAKYLAMLQELIH